MAVPSSGELELRGDIALEVYGSATGTNISLRAMSEIAGFTSPDAMTEFYGWQNATAPSVTTNSASSVGQTSFTANGNVTADGGATVSERGFYVGTNSAFPTNNSKYTTSGTTGAYSRSITGLSNGTTYYIWAFATNSAGTTYGSRVTQATVAAYQPNWVTKNLGDVAYATLSMYWNIDPNTMDYRCALYYLDPLTSSYVLYGQSVTYNAVNPDGISVNIDLADEINNYNGRGNGQYPTGITNRWQAISSNTGEMQAGRTMSFSTTQMNGMSVSTYTFNAGPTTGLNSATGLNNGFYFNPAGFVGTAIGTVDFSFTS